MTAVNERGEVLNLEGPNNDSKGEKKKPWWLVVLQITGLLFLLIILGYFVVFDNVQKVVESTASNFHWMYGWGSGIIAFLIAALIARPIYVSIGRAIIWKLRTRDYIVFGICFISVISSSYLNRNVFFGEGVAAKEVCAALIRSKKPTIEILGKGATQGLKCIPISREEAAFALSIDQNAWAKEIIPKTISELDALNLYENGAVVIYIGYAKSGDPKIYDGPDFNPRALGLLKSITEDELIAYKATQRSKLLGIENGRRLEKEAAAKAAAELAERQRAAAEAEARRLEQERLLAQAAEERRIQAENQARLEAKQKADAASKARSEWWFALLIFAGIIIGGTFIAGPIGFGIGLILLLWHLSKF